MFFLGDRGSWRADEDEDGVRGQPRAGWPHVNTGEECTCAEDVRECSQTKPCPQGQLTENGHRLDKLRSDLRRYQGWLEEADSPASTLSLRTNGGPEASPRRSSVSDEVESLSRSASDSSVNHNKNGSLVTSINSQGWVKEISGNHWNNPNKCIILCSQKDNNSNV